MAAHRDCEDVARLAARLLNAPMAVVSLCDRQWLGYGIGETAQLRAFCDEATSSPGVTVIGDATRDPRFRDHPMVTDAPAFRFFAGTTLTAETGERLGMLGVFDRRRRPGLDESEATALATLARVAAGHLDSRRQQRAADAQLRNITAEITKLHRLAKFGAWRCSADLRILEWSDEIYDIMGRPRRDFALTHRDFIACVHPDDRGAVQRINASFAADFTARDFEFRVVRPSGEVRHCWSHAQRCDTADISGVCQDVTERKRSEQALLQSERLHMMGALTGGVAHDFNNLLTVITLNLEEATASLPSDDSLQEVLQPAMHASLRGAELTRQLLSYAKRVPLRPMPVQPAALLGTLRPLLATALGPRHVLEIVLDDGEVGLWVDPGGLESAILNLLLNARDAMPEGGSIRLEVTSELRGGATDALKPGRYVVIAVRDWGTGIPPDVLARVFEPFFTTKGHGQGSGLGLSMVSGFAQQSGGGATIASVAGQGTTVTLHLPAHGASMPDEDAPAPQPDWQGAGLHALVVEDQPAVLVAVSRMLTQMGFAVTEAATAADAAAQLGSGQFDLLLTDIMLPGPMDGVGLAALARRRSAATQIVLSSGSARADCLAKPYRRADLYARLRTLFPTR